jgi:DNA-binding XRE family transcriptional regulator
MNAKGLTTSASRAEAIGVSRWTVSRIEGDEIAPGERFIAAVLLAHPELKFEDLFEVEEVEVTDPSDQEDD